MSTIQVGKGKAKVMLTGALAGDLERDLLAALGPWGEAIRAKGQTLLDGARSRWPVDTGASRAGLTLGYRVDTAKYRVEASVVSTAPYARWIRWAERRHMRTVGAA